MGKVNLKKLAWEEYFSFHLIRVVPLVFIVIPEPLSYPPYFKIFDDVQIEGTGTHRCY